MDTHVLTLAQDPLTMDRINVRARAVGDLTAAFHRFDASRYEWLAQQLLDADRPEAARLAFEWMREHLETARKLADQAEVA